MNSQIEFYTILIDAKGKPSSCYQKARASATPQIPDFLDVVYNWVLKDTFCISEDERYKKNQFINMKPIEIGLKETFVTPDQVLMIKFDHSI